MQSNLKSQHKTKLNKYKHYENKNHIYTIKISNVTTIFQTVNISYILH